MKTRSFIGAIALFFLLLTTVAGYAQSRKVKGSSTYKTKEIKIGNFDRIELLGSPTVEYTQSNNNKSELKIYGSDNLIDLLECRVSDNKLTVKFKNNLNIEYGKDGRLKVIVSSPSLKEARLQGSGDIILNNTVKTANMSLILQGSGDIKMNNLVCSNEFIATLQGSGDISVSKGAQAGKAILKLLGSGDLDVYNLTAGEVVASLQGSGDLKVNGSKINSEVTVTLQGSGDLDLTGIDGKYVKAELNGSGDMKLTGMTEQAVLVLNNSGSLDAANLKAKDVDARVSGSGDIKCAVSGELKTLVSGSGSIGYKGNPREVRAEGRRKPHRL